MATRSLSLGQFTGSSLQEARRILADDWEGHPPPVSFRTPVIVRLTAEGRFAVMDGYHRLAAALALGRKSLRGVVATEEEIRDHRGAGEEGEAAWIARVLRRARRRSA